ncbi:dihydrolipoyl dehydrogenase [Aciduricibacillus chroicocephali]|uniref:Dihydrolipoyl dehydrogenase n=1 Tax=Aciduricibacillus chroicocephali TaxID=3054939 RepID=A0ABY9KSL6_9BACI|nr:dihydrolipoyl dehydrogenase [Bacillaceae bacterium 44XB]
MAKEYDLVVLGGGPGGYVAAIKAAQSGLQVAIVEKEKLGGTCLHKGCIPSKALLRSAEVYDLAKHGADFGVIAGDVKVDFARVQERKSGIVEQLHSGVQHLMKKGKIDVFEGFGRILGPSIFSPMPGTISIEYADGRENTMIVPKHVLIATGSRPRTLPGLAIDGEFILSSEEALEMDRLPESMLIVGGGAIGIEWASMLVDFDVEVTVLEYADRILPGMDKDVSRTVQTELEKRGVKFVLSAKVLPETLSINESVEVKAETKKGLEQFTASKMLVSVGREANTEGIGLENTSIVVENGYIRTNEFYQTKEKHIYAIGDCIGGIQLAHVASHEGIKAVEHMAGTLERLLDYNTVPVCVYSRPEAASVGFTEQEAVDKGYAIKIGKFPFQANGKALVQGETAGFVKFVTDEATDDLLGVHIVGTHATDMITEAGLAKVLDATSWEISETIHPHPTLSEAIGEAALAVDGKQIHG